VPVTQFADNLSSYALETIRATTTCPFHWKVTIRVGDDAAESHAMARAGNIIRSDGTHWEKMALGREFDRQLRGAADRDCPQCSYLVDDPSI
jgi:hypothetical protein